MMLGAPERGGKAHATHSDGDRFSGLTRCNDTLKFNQLRVLQGFAGRPARPNLSALNQEKGVDHPEAPRLDLQMAMRHCTHRADCE